MGVRGGGSALGRAGTSSSKRTKQGGRGGAKRTKQGGRQRATEPGDAHQVFDRLLKRGDRASIFDLNRALSDVARASPAVAISLFNRMPRAGATSAAPNIATYGIVIGCCRRLGRLDLAFATVGRVITTGLRMSPILFSPLLKGLCDRRRTSDAMDIVLRRMPELGCKPDLFSYTILLKAPPPPHISPPAPVPPPPSPPPHIVIIVVFVSFGGLLLLACLAALFCWHKKKRRGTERKAEVHNLSGHVHVHKATESGPGGAKATVLSIDEDLKFQEVAGESSSAAGAGSHHTPWSWHRRQQEGKAENKAELINVTEHIHVDEKIVSGPQGQKIEILSEDEDIRFEEAGRKEKGDERSKTRITKT
ncbi:hypothetical protein OsI_27535 [Oryza sativa Indica Group]|uniref:Pentatricopeptide repeat-containing protein n=1 Tax=Oryza sativa subsp. indica TaxID=39946 RepID=B8BA43_ORYSI|nr:hypothetical protein OsI_27535 [Oryza sativa Indica Group]